MNKRSIPRPHLVVSCFVVKTMAIKIPFTFVLFLQRITFIMFCNLIFISLKDDNYSKVRIT